METMKCIVDVVPTDRPVTRKEAHAAALEEVGGGVVRLSRIHEEEGTRFWQVVIEKTADFPPKDDDTSDDSAPADDSDGDGESDSKPKGDGDDLPSKLHDVIDEHAAGEEDAKGQLAEALSGLVDQIQSIVDELGGGPKEEEGDEGDLPDDPMPEDGPLPDDTDDVEFMPNGGPPAGPARRPKPPMMAKKNEQVVTTPKVGTTLAQAKKEARLLPREMPILKGYKLAGVTETKTKYVARYTR